MSLGVRATADGATGTRNAHTPTSAILIALVMVGHALEPLEPGADALNGYMPNRCRGRSTS